MKLLMISSNTLQKEIMKMRVLNRNPPFHLEDKVYKLILTNKSIRTCLKENHKKTNLNSTFNFNKYNLMIKKFLKLILRK